MFASARPIEFEGALCRVTNFGKSLGDTAPTGNGGYRYQGPDPLAIAPDYKAVKQVLGGRLAVYEVDKDGIDIGPGKGAKFSPKTIQIHHMVPRYVQRIAGIWGGENLAKEDGSPSIAWTRERHIDDFHRGALDNGPLKIGLDNLAQVYGEIANQEEGKARGQLVIDLKAAYEKKPPRGISDPTLGTIAEEWIKKVIESEMLPFEEEGLQE